MGKLIEIPLWDGDVSVLNVPGSVLDINIPGSALNNGTRCLWTITGGSPWYGSVKEAWEAQTNPMVRYFCKWLYP